MLPWSEEECRNFEHALLLYEKNFHLIQKHKVRWRLFSCVFDPKQCFLRCLNLRKDLNKSDAAHIKHMKFH